MKVLLNGRLVGALRLAGSAAISFTYDPDWLSWEVEIADFEDVRSLVAARFDRRWTKDCRLIRLPQEDVNGGVKTCYWGGAKVGHCVPRLGA